MDRRRFLQIAVLAPAVAVVPIAYAAEEPLRWRHVQQYTMNADELPIRAEFDTQLRMSDLRELTQYYIVRDVFFLRHDICYVVNGRGKQSRYHVSHEIVEGESLESLNGKRALSLKIQQDTFDRRKRIRANLVPLQIPLGMHVPSAEEIIRGVR